MRENATRRNAASFLQARWRTWLLARRATRDLTQSLDVHRWVRSLLRRCVTSFVAGSLVTGVCQAYVNEPDGTSLQPLVDRIELLHITRACRLVQSLWRRWAILSVVHSLVTDVCHIHGEEEEEDDSSDDDDPDDCVAVPILNLTTTNACRCIQSRWCAYRRVSRAATLITICFCRFAARRARTHSSQSSLRTSRLPAPIDAPHSFSVTPHKQPHSPFEDTASLQCAVDRAPSPLVRSAPDGGGHGASADDRRGALIAATSPLVYSPSEMVDIRDTIEWFNASTHIVAAGTPSPTSSLFHAARCFNPSSAMSACVAELGHLPLDLRYDALTALRLCSVRHVTDWAFQSPDHALALASSIVTASPVDVPSLPSSSPSYIYARARNAAIAEAFLYLRSSQRSAQMTDLLVRSYAEYMTLADAPPGQLEIMGLARAIQSQVRVFGVTTEPSGQRSQYLIFSTGETPQRASSSHTAPTEPLDVLAVHGCYVPLLRLKPHQHRLRPRTLMRRILSSWHGRIFRVRVERRVLTAGDRLIAQQRLRARQSSHSRALWQRLRACVLPIVQSTLLQRRTAQRLCVRRRVAAVRLRSLFRNAVSHARSSKLSSGTLPSAAPERLSAIVEESLCRICGASCPVRSDGGCEECPIAPGAKSPSSASPQFCAGSPPATLLRDKGLIDILSASPVASASPDVRIAISHMLAAPIDVGLFTLLPLASTPRLPSRSVAISRLRRFVRSRRAARAAAVMREHIDRAIFDVHRRSILSRGPLSTDSIGRYFSRLPDAVEDLQRASQSARDYLARHAPPTEFALSSCLLDSLDADISSSISPPGDDPAHGERSSSPASVLEQPSHWTSESNDASPTAEAWCDESARDSQCISDAPSLAPDQVKEIHEVFQRMQQERARKLREDREHIDSLYRLRLRESVGLSRHDVSRSHVARSFNLRAVPKSSSSRRGRRGLSPPSVYCQLAPGPSSPLRICVVSAPAPPTALGALRSLVPCWATRGLVPASSARPTSCACKVRASPTAHLDSTLLSSRSLAWVPSISSSTTRPSSSTLAALSFVLKTSPCSVATKASCWATTSTGPRAPCMTLMSAPTPRVRGSAASWSFATSIGLPVSCADLLFACARGWWHCVHTPGGRCRCPHRLCAGGHPC